MPGTTHFAAGAIRIVNSIPDALGPATIFGSMLGSAGTIRMV
jgi:hypothetical protein